MNTKLYSAELDARNLTEKAETWYMGASASLYKDIAGNYYYGENEYEAMAYGPHTFEEIQSAMTEWQEQFDKDVMNDIAYEIHKIGNEYFPYDMEDQPDDEAISEIANQLIEEPAAITNWMKSYIEDDSTDEELKDKLELILNEIEGMIW